MISKNEVETELSRALFQKYFPYSLSNVAYVRAITQYFSYKYLIKCNNYFFIIFRKDAILNEYEKINMILKKPTNILYFLR